MKTILITIITWMVMTTSGWARELTFHEALALANEHSFQLKRATAERKAYENNFQAVVAERMPTLTLTGVASYKDEVPSLNLSLPGNISLNRELGSNETYLADARLTLPLYTGGKIGSSIDMAQASAGIYEALVQQTEDQLALGVRTEYLQLVRAEKLLISAEAELERAVLINNDVQSLYQAGAADSVDILEAALVINNARQGVKTAQINRRQVELRLLTLLGIEPSDSLKLLDEPTAPQLPATTADSIAVSHAHLMIAASSINLNQAMVNLNRSDYFPTLSVYGGYVYGKPNNDFFNDRFNDYFSVGTNLSWSFNFGGRAKSKVGMAKYQLEAAHRQYDDTRETLNKEARLSLENLKLAYEQYLTAETSYQISSDNYRLARSKYGEGVMALNRLLDIEAALAEAEATLNAAAIGYHIIKGQYYYYLGSEKLKEGF